MGSTNTIRKLFANWKYLQDGDLGVPGHKESEFHALMFDDQSKIKALFYTLPTLA